MTRDDLYQAAFEYKRTKLWKKLWDNDIFALRLSDGRIGYINVMGRLGEYCALGVNIGEEGVQAMVDCMVESPEGSSLFGEFEHLLSQRSLHLELCVKDDLDEGEVDEVRAFAKENNIRLSGKNSFPRFVRFEPAHVPWKITEESDLNALYEAVRAAIMLSGQMNENSLEDFGITGVVPEDTPCQVPLFQAEEGKLVRKGEAPFPAPSIRHYETVPVRGDIIPARHKKIPRKGTWEAEAVRFIQPFQKEEDEAPYYPLMLLLCASKSGYLVAVRIHGEIGDNPVEFFEEYTRQWEKLNYRPNAILCRDERTMALLEDVCAKTGVGIKITQSDMPALDKAQEDMYMHFTSPQQRQMEDVVDQIVEMFTQVIEMPLDSLREMFQSSPGMAEELWRLSRDESLPIPRNIADEVRSKLEKLR